MFPVIKWAGGKTQLLEQIKSLMPTKYDHYYEPFVGSGAVFLGLAPTSYIHINDINFQLMNLFVQIKENCDSLIGMVDDFDSVPCTKEFYYEMRKQYNEAIKLGIYSVRCAALLIWINKHCFNGLYRVNNQGIFNVPYNNKTGGRSINEDNIREISAYLNRKKVFMYCGDYKDLCRTVTSGDFVYFDSPYVPESPTASFTKYTRNGFNLQDHEDLAELFKKLDKEGAKLMLSNNDVPLVRELYKGYNIHSFDVRRMINRNSSKRTGKEVIITNY